MNELKVKIKNELHSFLKELFKGLKRYWLVIFAVPFIYVLSSNFVNIFFINLQFFLFLIPSLFLTLFFLKKSNGAWLDKQMVLTISGLLLATLFFLDQKTYFVEDSFRVIKTASIKNCTLMQKYQNELSEEKYPLVQFISAPYYENANIIYRYLRKEQADSYIVGALNIDAMNGFIVVMQNMNIAGVDQNLRSSARNLMIQSRTELKEKIKETKNIFCAPAPPWWQKISK